MVLSQAGPSNFSSMSSTPRQSTSKSRKRPAKLALVAAPPRKRSVTPEKVVESRSVPASPMQELSDSNLRDTLRGAPRRRPSVVFSERQNLPPLTIPNAKFNNDQLQMPNTAIGPPSIWQDPSEHILSGQGSSLQHARSSYASGPIQILPGLFLGDEFNARDEECLANCGITTILNVAKETILPCQDDSESREIGFVRRSLVRGLHIHDDDAPTPTSARPIEFEAKDGFYTPVTSFPQADLSPPKQKKFSRPSSLYIRNTLSTPNLSNSFNHPTSPASMVPGAYQLDTVNAESSDEEGESAATSSFTSQTDDTSPPSPLIREPKLSPSISTPLSSTFSRVSPATGDASASSTTSSAGSYTIALPNNAVALSVPPPANSNQKRTWPIRYIKLPWTHDETDLAALSSLGGFATGCAIIADALGIDLRGSNSYDDLRQNSRGGILVHCQCGVSRSATLVIAFVMQAAAFQYSFQEAQTLTGMHDCYEMVKSRSNSISPNISLIYQLVEWERLLSGQVALLPNATSVDEKTSAYRRWGKEVMDEDEWMRMRAEEERKEREQEEEKSRQMEEWQKSRESAAQTKPILAPLAIGGNLSTSAGVGMRRKKKSPSLTLLSSSKVNADRMINEQQQQQQQSSNESSPLQSAPVTARESPPPSAFLTPASAFPTKPSNQKSQNMSIFPWLQSHSAALGGSANSSPRTISRPLSGHGAGGFGVMGQSAAERRDKHKRTFSAEVPEWSSSRRQVFLSRNKTDSSRLKYVAASRSLGGSSDDHETAVSD